MFAAWLLGGQRPRASRGRYRSWVSSGELSRAHRDPAPNISQISVSTRLVKRLVSWPVAMVQVVWCTLLSMCRGSFNNAELPEAGCQTDVVRMQCLRHTPGGWSSGTYGVVYTVLCESRPNGGTSPSVLLDADPRPSQPPAPWQYPSYPSTYYVLAV